MVTLQLPQYFEPMWKRVFILLSFIVLASCGYRAEVAAEESGVLFHQGLKMFYLGDLPQARDCFKRVVTRQKDNDAAFYYLAQIAGYAGQWKESEQYLQKALKLDPENYWYRLQQAKLAVAAGKTQEAGLLYENLWRDYPDKTELLYDRIALYMDGHNAEKALELLDTLEGREGVTESGVLLRFNLTIDRDKEAARTLLREYATHTPTPRVLCLLGDLEAGDGETEKAGEYYQKALESDPAFMPAVFGMAEVYRMKRQFDLYFQNINVFLAYPEVDVRMKTDYLKQILETRAFVATFQPQVDTLFQSTRSAHRTDSTLAYIYAGFLIQTQNPSGALEVIKDNIRYYPKDYHAWYQTLGVIYYLKEWPLLCEYGSKALESFPDDADFGSLYGLALWQTGQLDQAIARFERILSLLKKDDKTNKVQTLSLLGDLYHEKGAWELSFRTYEEVLRLDRQNLPVLNNYAYYLSLQGEQLEKALSMSQVTIEKEPNNATYLDTYGWILHLLGRSAEARNIFRQAMAYGGKESAEILNHYGDVLNALNEPLMAIVYWQQAYAIEPREDIRKKIDNNKKPGQ